MACCECCCGATVKDPSTSAPIFPSSAPVEMEMKRGDGFNEVYVMELNSKLITGNSKKNSKRRQVIVIRSTNEATSMAQLQNRFEKFYNIDSRAEPGRSLWLHAQQQIQRMSQTTPNVPLVL